MNKVEKAREARLWIRQIIIPAVIGSAFVIEKCPELKEKVKTKFKEVKDKFNS